MKRTTYDALVSFLGGASWAFVLIGSWITFQSFIFLGVVPALMFTFLFIFLSLFMLVILDTLSRARDRHEETLKQTQLLEEIRDSLKSVETRVDE